MEAMNMEIYEYHEIPKNIIEKCEEEEAIHILVQYKLNLDDIIITDKDDRECAYQMAVAHVCNEIIITQCPECEEMKLQTEMVDTSDMDIEDLTNDVEACKPCAERLESNADMIRAEIKGDIQCHEGK